MIYRVVLKVKYYERWFDFETIIEAGKFAETILTHGMVSEDNPEVETEIKIRVVKGENE